jgi:hypothetical protein
MSSGFNGLCARTTSSPCAASLLRSLPGRGFLKAADTVILLAMSDATATQLHIMPSAAADEAEIAAWNALPRDEQVRRYRDLFASPACHTITNDSMSDILAAARQRVAARRHG